MDKFILLIGASSFLGTNLIDKIQGYTVDTVRTHLGETIPYEDIGKYHCIIYLNPDADQKLLELKTTTPLLSIGSGALVDFKAGRLPLNPYIEGKQKLVQMSSVTIHPGFYIPDGTHKDTGRGLHRDTLITLFSGKPIPADFNMNKGYYMTPVGKLIQLILRFIDNPTHFHGEYAFGSEMPITRKELMEGAIHDVKRIYADDMKQAKWEFGLEVDNHDVRSFTQDAKAWVEKILKDNF